MNPIYSKVTESIVASLEQGARPWSSRWSSMRPVRHDGTPYNGINVVMLWSAAAQAGYANPRWMTYKQAQALGGQVRGGEHGSLVVYADRAVRKETDADGNESEHAFSFLKSYTVFNVEQIDRLPERFALNSDVPRHLTERLESAQRFFVNTGAKVVHEGDRAYYRPADDSIHLPHPIAFRDAEAYISTKAHEFIHWTGSKSRLDRNLSGRFGDHAYALEELTAELGAAFLCAELGVSSEPREDHASYLQSWIGALKADARAIFTVASLSQKACEYLAALQSEAIAEPLAA